MSGKKIVALVAVLGVALVLAAPAVAADKVDLTGKYKCEGKNPQGGTYTGTVEIKKKGDVYYLSWAIGPAETYEGIGLLEGDVLAVSYTGGVVAYKVEKGPKLVGRWTLSEGADKGKVFTETLTK